MPPRRRRQQTPQSAERTAAIVYLRGLDQPFSRIGEQFGISGERARQIYGQALDRTISDAVNDVRAQLSDLADSALAELLAIAADKTATRRSRIDALTSARGWANELARLHGAYRPEAVEVTTPEIEQERQQRVRVDEYRRALAVGQPLPIGAGTAGLIALAQHRRELRAAGEPA